jgi:hypothetical protein
LNLACHVHPNFNVTVHAFDDAGRKPLPALYFRLSSGRRWVASGMDRPPDRRALASRWVVGQL